MRKQVIEEEENGKKLIALAVVLFVSISFSQLKKNVDQAVDKSLI